MKRFTALAVLLLALARPAKAQTQFFMTESSCTYAGVAVSSQNATRVDNLTQDSTSQVLLSRDKVRIMNLQGNPGPVYFGYDSRVSTQATSGFLGEELSTGTVRDLLANSNMQIFARSLSSNTSSYLSIQQCRPIRPPTLSN